MENSNSSSGVLLPVPPTLLYLRIAELEAQVYLERQRADAAEAKCDALTAMLDSAANNASAEPRE